MSHPVGPGAGRDTPARWFPLYLSLVAALVLSPLAVSQFPRPWSVAIVPTDVVLNFIAFVPFGWAMRRRSVVHTALAALAFSGGLECLQVYLLRVPSGWDIASNTLGAIIGARVSWASRIERGLAAHVHRVGRLAIGGSLLLVAAAVWETHRAADTDFSNWEPVPFYIGAEELGEPRWDGLLRRVRLYDRRLDLRAKVHDEVTPLLDARFTGDATAYLDDGSGAAMLRLQPDSGGGFSVTDAGLRLGEGHWALPDTIAALVLARARATNAISILADLVPAPEPQPGLRRLFALSSGAVERNFSVAQRDGKLLVRARSPFFGTDGDARAVAIGPADAPMQLRAAIDRHWFVVSTDGNAVVEEYLPMRVMPWPLGTGFTITYAAILVLMMLGMATLVSRAPVARWIAMTASAAALCALLSVTGVFDRHAITVWNIVLPPVVWLLACLYVAGARVSASPRCTVPGSHAPGRVESRRSSARGS